MIESRIQTFDCEVFSNIVFRMDNFNEVFSIRDFWFCYTNNFDLFSDDCFLNWLLFKTEYGRNILVQSIQYQWELSPIR